MTDMISAYLPQDRRVAVACGSELPTQAQGTVCLADIAGFTPLTEMLVRTLGPARGAEALANCLDRAYTALIDVVECWGGSVMDFSGDAILCWWAAANVSPHDAAARAVACAMDMHEALKGVVLSPIPDGEAFHLSLKVAVASGTTQRIVVGDPSIRQFDVLVGEPIERLGGMDSLLRPGEVLVDAITAGLLSPDLQVAAWRCVPQSGEQVAVIAQTPLSIPAIQAPAPPSVPLEQARPWLIVTVAERLATGLGEFLTELRPVVALLVHFGGVTAIEDSATQLLDRYIRWVQRVLANYNGTLLQLTLGDKGSYLYAAFGAPKAHEDDVRRALWAALALRIPPSDVALGHSPRIGISQGMLRAGSYGSTTRRTYGALGDAVNVAARLMHASQPGDILVTERIQRLAASGFTWEVLSPVRVKGKQGPIAVARLIEHQPLSLHDPARGSILIGRDTELAWLHQRVRSLVTGRFGGVITICGEAGIGKTCLLMELRHQLQTTQMVAWYTWPADSVLQQSLRPIRAWLWHFFAQHEAQTEAERKVRFEVTLDDLIATVVGADADSIRQELDRTRSFLGALIGLRWEHSLYEQLDPQLHFQNTLIAIKVLIRALCRRQPLVLHLEDAHWLDEDTQTVLHTLTRNVDSEPFIVIMSSRYRDDGQPIDLSFDETVPCVTLQLASLSSAEVQAVAEHLLGGPIADEVTTLLSAKTGGNPFFVEQLTLDLQERGNLLQHSGGIWRVENKGRDLPDTITAVLIARLDRLPPQIKAIVQLAAVLGQEFDLWVLSHMVGGDPQVLQKVQQAEQEAIWHALDDRRYLFRHVLLRDVAYSMQAGSRRKELHFLAGSVLEQLYVDHLAAHAADLAYHYSQAEVHQKERYYARLAGEIAAERFANQEAINYLSRALVLTRQEDREERVRVLLAREHVYELLGDRAAQQQDLYTLEQLADQADDDAQRAEIAVRKAVLAEDIGDYQLAIEEARRAIAIGEQIAAMESISQGYLQLGIVLVQQGDLDMGRQYLLQALRIVQNAQLPAIEAEVLRRLGGVAQHKSDYDEVLAYTAQARVIYNQIGDRRGELRTLNMVGNVAFLQSNLAEAQRIYQQTLELAQAIGDRRMERVVLNNLGSVLAICGNTAESRVMQERALVIARDIGDRAGEVKVLGDLGFCAYEEGRFDAAQLYLHQALHLLDQIGEGDAWLQGIMGLVCLGQGMYREAQSILRSALASIRSLRNRHLESWALCCIGLLHDHRGKHVSAQVAGRQALHLAREIDDPDLESFALIILGHGNMGCGQMAVAAESYQQAFVIRQKIGLLNAATEPRAGLARIALAQGDLVAACAHVDAILERLVGDSRPGIREPFRVDLTCCLVLQAANDPRFDELLERTYTRLQVWGAYIDDQERRRMFLEHVPHHCEIVALWEARRALA